MNYSASSFSAHWSLCRVSEIYAFPESMIRVTRARVTSSARLFIAWEEDRTVNTHECSAVN